MRSVDLSYSLWTRNSIGSDGDNFSKIKIMIDSTDYSIVIDIWK